MRKYFVLLLIGFITCSVWADDIVGTKSAYPEPLSVVETAPPAGYHAFFINHLNRHGSRYLSQPKQDKLVIQVLQHAQDKQALTPLGQQLLQLTTQLRAVNQQHYGLLTPLGQQQLQAIGERMLNHYPTVFKGGNLPVLTTHVQRTKQSAEAFLTAFRSHYPALTLSQQNESEETTLRFYDFAPALQDYQKGKPVKKALQQWRHADETKQAELTVVTRLFTAEFVAQLGKGLKSDSKPLKTDDFVKSLYNLYQETCSFLPAQRAQFDFSPFLTEAEKSYFDLVSSSEDFLKIGPAFDHNGIQAKVAIPLLNNLLQTSALAIEKGSYDAYFRFAHAETLSPLATLMELEGAANETSDIKSYRQHWQAEKIAPMAANIQLIFYRQSDQTQPILVKVLLNEQAVHLPISTAYYPYYKWSELNAYYQEKLARFKLPPSRNDKALLQALQH